MIRGKKRVRIMRREGKKGHSHLLQENAQQSLPRYSGDKDKTTRGSTEAGTRSLNE